MIYFRWEPILHTSGDLLMGFIHLRIKYVKVGSQVFYTLPLGVNRVNRVSGYTTPYEPLVCDGSD